MDGGDDDDDDDDEEEENKLKYCDRSACERFEAFTAR
jgi:hypothetical protein